MVYSKIGDEIFFDPGLLECFKHKNNVEAIQILRGYCRTNQSLQLHELKDWKESTLLHYAAENGNAEMVQYLLNLKCKVDTQDNLKTSPLMLAIKDNHEEVFNVLLNANADITIIDYQGKNALQMIFELEPLPFIMLRKLFQYVSWKKIIQIIKPDELVNKIVSKVDDLARNALILESAKFLKYLLNRKMIVVDAFYDLTMKKTLLHEAVQLKNVKVVRVLVDFGANVDTLDCWDATPLSYLYDGHDKNEFEIDIKILKLLIPRANLLTISTFYGHMQISKILQYGNIEATNIILQSNINLSIADKKGNTGLHYLAKNCNVDLVVLKRGIKCDVNARDNDGCTPLHIAAQYKSFNVIKFTLDCDVNVNMINKSGETALHLAFLHFKDLSDKKSVELLLQHGANPQTCVINGNETITIFDLIISRSQVIHRFELDFTKIHDHLKRALPLLAYLAIIQGIGKEISMLIREKINLKPLWIKYFDKFCQQVERMKHTKFYNNITLLEFLTASERKTNVYARNEELVSKLEKSIQEFEVKSPYPKLLRNHLTRVIQLAELKDKSTEAMCRIKGSVNVHYFAVQSIVDYLSIQDMENLCLASEFAKIVPQKLF